MPFAAAAFAPAAPVVPVAPAAPAAPAAFAPAAPVAPVAPAAFAPAALAPAALAPAAAAAPLAPFAPLCFLPVVVVPVVVVVVELVVAPVVSVPVVPAAVVELAVAPVVSVPVVVVELAAAPVVSVPVVVVELAVVPVVPVAEVVEFAAVAPVAPAAAVEFAAPAAAAAPPAPWLTKTQFPKPPAVVKLTRQLAWSFPPVQVVPAGSVPDTWTEPVVWGDFTPFVVIVAEPPSNEAPVPVVSIAELVISVEPSVPLCACTDSAKGNNKRDGSMAHPLKFVTVTAKAFPFAVTAWLPGIACATFTPLPHGDFVLGFVTSARAGVPVTPSAGVMIACALAAERAERRTASAEKGLESIVLMIG